jgi:hypothetical protein
MGSQTTGNRTTIFWSEPPATATAQPPTTAQLPATATATATATAQPPTTAQLPATATATATAIATAQLTTAQPPTTAQPTATATAQPPTTAQPTATAIATATARLDHGPDLVPSLLPTLSRHYVMLELPTMGAQGPAVIRDWNKTSLWSPQSIGHQHPTVQQCTTIVPSSLGVDELTEVLAHHAHDVILWGAHAIQQFYHSAAYRVLCQLQLRLHHLLFLVALVLICRVCTEVFQFALCRGVWGHPSRRHAPRFGTAGVYRGTTRGISWCRIRPRNLRQLQRDPTLTSVRALSTGHRAYFADDEQLERFADSLCCAHAAGLPMGLCRWLSNPLRGRYQCAMLLAVIAFFTRLTWLPLVSFYLPSTLPKLLSVGYQWSQWLDQLQLSHALPPHQLGGSSSLPRASWTATATNGHPLLDHHQRTIPTGAASVLFSA